MSLGYALKTRSTFKILLYSANYESDNSFSGGEILETFYVFLYCLQMISLVFL